MVPVQAWRKLATKTIHGSDVESPSFLWPSEYYMEVGDGLVSTQGHLFHFHEYGRKWFLEKIVGLLDLPHVHL